MDLTKLQGKRFYGKARTQFLVYRDSIEAAIAQGYPLTVIWKAMRDDDLFDAKYDQFVRYVNTLIRGRKPQPGKPTAKPELKPSMQKDYAATASNRVPVESAPETSPEETSTPRMLGGFKMDPNRPKRPPVDLPKPFEWNPLPLTEEEIRTGKITSR